MKIGFIGAGKVGTAFGIYLKSHNLQVQGYYSRTYESAIEAARATKTVAYEKLDDLVKLVDIIFITTNDDGISKVSKTLAEENILSSGQILVHMSGAASSEILQDAKDKGCFTYSLHPLQAFADADKAVEALNDTVFSLEGDEERIDVMESILRVLGNQYFKLKKEQKSMYHATACVVSNYLVTLMEYGLSLFESIGIDKKEGYKALYPLIEGTIDNINRLGTKDALTGPIARGDVKTIEKHIEGFKSICPENLSFYRELGIKTLKLAEAKKLKDKEAIKELKKLLDGVN